MDWNSSILWGIIGLVGGFIISLLFYILGKNSKIMLYNIETQLIADDCFGQLNIKYNEEEINQLYHSILIFKNISLNTISYDDFANKDGLYIYSEGKTFVDIYSMIPCPINGINFNLKKDKEDSHHICIDFEFLKKKQLAICSVYHTDKIHLCGVLKNGNIYLFKKLKP